MKNQPGTMKNHEKPTWSHVRKVPEGSRRFRKVLEGFVGQNNLFCDRQTAPIIYKSLSLSPEELHALLRTLLPFVLTVFPPFRKLCGFAWSRNLFDFEIIGFSITWQQCWRRQRWSASSVAASKATGDQRGRCLFGQNTFNKKWSRALHNIFACWSLDQNLDWTSVKQFLESWFSSSCSFFFSLKKIKISTKSYLQEKQRPQAGKGPTNDPVRQFHHGGLLFCHLCWVVDVNLRYKTYQSF